MRLSLPQPSPDKVPGTRTTPLPDEAPGTRASLLPDEAPGPGISPDKVPGILTFLEEERSPVAKPTTLARTIARTPAEETELLHQEISACAELHTGMPTKNTIGTLQHGLMCPQPPYAMTHAATPLLMRYATHGCPVDCGKNWSRDHILLMLRRGPHQSALARKAMIQLRHETLEKRKHGYARVVKWGDIKNDIPPNLKISPVAMIPHKSKPYRCILDLSFGLEHNGITYPSVNELTNKLANQLSMGQLGFVVWRLINVMEANRQQGMPFWFAKLDVKDGFWRMAVKNEDAWNFAYVLPSLNKGDDVDDINLVIPNSLQMGWCESPPLFCTGSETARDIMVDLSTKDLPEHKYEKDMLNNEAIKLTKGAPASPTTLFESYVDDFITATNDGRHPHLQKLSRAMLHGIHAIFPPPETTGHSGHDSIAHKKLVAGDGVWNTRKEILGWEIDGANYTIQLPAKKSSDICALTKKCLKQREVPIGLFRKLAGKLQHASFAIPNGRALFTPFDMAMRDDPKQVVIDAALRQCLIDWRFLVQCLSNRPTHTQQLVAGAPHFIGYTDACKLSAGGGVVRGDAQTTPVFMADRMAGYNPKRSYHARQPNGTPNHQ